MGLQSLEDESLKSYSSENDQRNRQLQNGNHGDKLCKGTKNVSQNRILVDGLKNSSTRFQYNNAVMKTKPKNRTDRYKKQENQKMMTKELKNKEILEGESNDKRAIKNKKILTRHTSSGRYKQQDKKIAENRKIREMTDNLYTKDDNRISDLPCTESTSKSKDRNQKPLTKDAQNLSKLVKKTIEAVLESKEEEERSSKEIKQREASYPMYLDSNRYSEESCYVHRRHRHRSETIVKEPCTEPVEHEEECEKRDLSKDELLDLCRGMMGREKQNKTNVADAVLTLIESGIISLEQLHAELSYLMKSMEHTKKLETQNSKRVETSHKETEKESHYKVYCTKEEIYDAAEKTDPMKEDDDKEKISDNESSSKATDKHTEWKENVECLKEECGVEKSENEVDLKYFKKGEAETFDVKKVEKDICDDCKIEKFEKLQARQLLIDRKNWNVDGVYPEKITDYQFYVIICSSDIRGHSTIYLHKIKNRKYTALMKRKHIAPHVKPRIFRRNKRRAPKYNGSGDGGQRSCRQCGLGGNQTMSDRPKGDNPGRHQLTDSDSERHSSRGSQRSDEQEETEKEKRGRNEDDEKDRDENEEPPMENSSHGNEGDRVSSALEVLANFKYRRKHGHLEGGESRLSDMLGLMIHETEDLKVPPDIFEQINLCLMTSMQVKYAGETTTCFICAHVSALICHFGSCSMGYHNTCSLCMTLFKLIQKHVASCGLSDSFTSEVTCPVIICVKIKRSEMAFDNEEKVWKKLKKNLARFSNPDAVDDDPFMSMDSITSIRNPVAPRPTRLSTVTRPLLESIPESGAGVKLKSTRKPISSSEPIMRKNADGSTVMMAGNLPQRLQHEDMRSIAQYASIPYNQGRLSLTSYTTVLKDVATDSTDYPPEIRTLENISDQTNTDILYDRTRPPIGSESDGISHNSLPAVNNESSVLSAEYDYESLPGRIYGDSDKAISIQFGGRKEVGDRYSSLADRPMGIPGIQDVVYGEKNILLHVARIWYDMKDMRKNGKKLDSREEGVILPAFMDRLKILKMRYSKNFQWVRLSHLGSGTSGKCHLAMDFNTEYKFCIKKIHLSKYEVRELEIWSDLRHKNIVQLIGTLRRGEKIYILQEFIDGGCLTETINSQRVLNRRLSQWTAINYLKQILEALVYLQKKYVIHEDLKADNILVRSGTKDIVITDFGVARKLTSSTDKRGATPSGSQIVFSPEKARGEGHGYKSDLWSAICVLVHMLTGHPPWVRKFPNIGALLYVIIEQTPDIPNNIHEDVADLIRKGFNKDPDKRPSSDQLLQHRVFSMLDEKVNQDTIYSVLQSSFASQIHIGDSSLKLDKEDKNNETIVEEIVEELKSIHVSSEVEKQIKEIQDTVVRVPQEHDSMENIQSGNRNNSSLDIKKIAMELGISIPENLIVKEEEPPDNVLDKFLKDNGEVALSQFGLEEIETSTERQSSDTDTSQSDLEFEIQPHSDLPNFELLFPKEEKLTEKEKEEKQEFAAYLEQYHESVLTTQLSRTESQHNQSFESSQFSSQNESTEVVGIREEITNQTISTSKHSFKTSVDVPALTIFHESLSSSSDKLTIKVSSDSADSQKDQIENVTTTLTISSTNTLTPSPTTLSGPVDGILRLSSKSPSLFSIGEEVDIDDDNLFGSGEGEEMLKNKMEDKNTYKIKTEESVVKKGQNKAPNLHLNLSPASQRKTYNMGNSRSDPVTAHITATQSSPLPPTKPYFTPQVMRLPPFLLTQPAVKSPTTSGLGNSLSKSPPHQSIENDTSGAWSSPRSQQEAIEKLFEELSSTSGTDIHMSQEIEDTPHFSLGDESDDEASMMYVQQQYLSSAPTANDISRLIVHHREGQTFTMGISGSMIKHSWKDIIEDECSEIIHDRMGVEKFILLDSHNQVLDLQKKPSQGELIVYVEEVKEPNDVPWYCEAGMVTGDTSA